MSNDSQAKNFVLIPTKSHKALVIRRGPAKQVGVFLWDLKSDEIKGYQWLKGRIYEYFSDLSPDGKYFLYSANKKGESYTALSRAPWIKALSLWRNVGGYGGGVLNSNDSYMLFDGSETYNTYRTKALSGVSRNRELLEHGVYPARLLRNGWSLIEKTEEYLKFSKELGKSKSIIKTWHNWTPSTPNGTPSFWESHQLVFDNECIQKDSWEWCEVYRNQLLWSERGCIYRSLKSDIFKIKAPKLVHDFNHESFVERLAPY
jgi:hypothetical protein